MVALRILRHRFAAHLGFVLALYAAMPSQIAQQDLASLLTFRQAPTSGARLFLSCSALRTATFSLPRPAAFAIPELPESMRPHGMNFDPDITGSIGRSSAAIDAGSEYEEPQTTVMNRAGKSDRLQVQSKVAAISARPVTLSNDDAASAIRQDLPPLETASADE